MHQNFHQNHFFHGPHFHHHGHWPHMSGPHYVYMFPNFIPNVFPHHWPHIFPPFIHPHNNYHYPHFYENNRNYNNIPKESNNSGKYIPNEDDYDYSELYDFGNNKKEEIIQSEINNIEENNLRESDNTILSSKNSEIKQEENQQNIINNIENNNQNKEDEKEENKLEESNFNLIHDNEIQEKSSKNNFDDQIKKSQNNNDFCLLNSIKLSNSIDINEIDININNENNKQILLESNHEHPLIYLDNLNLTCTICQQIDKNHQGYKCEECPTVLCLNCAEKIFFGNNKLSIHPHILLLKFKNDWKCNICDITFKNTSAFSCDECQFNVCSFCLIPK